MSELTRELLSRLLSYLISWDLRGSIYINAASAARNGYVKAPFADRNRKNKCCSNTKAMLQSY